MTNSILLDLLTRLYEEKEIPYSSVAAGVRKEFEDWGERKNCIRVIIQGHGKSFKVVNENALKWEINHLSPCIDLQDLPARVQNLAKNNNTKTGETTLERSYFLCKAVGSSIFVNGTDVSAVTKALDCFALSICDNTNGVACNDSLLLVENQLLLDDLRWVPSSFKGIVLYYAGNLSMRLRSWIKKSSFASIMLFPDYDAVGIRNYANLIEDVPCVKWFWMDKWKEKLAAHGCKELRKKGNQDSIFENLWIQFKEYGFPDAELESLMTEIRKQGKMLEQEAVLI